MLHGYGSSILDGAWLSINLALSAMALAITLGLLGAAFRLSPVKWLANLGEAYTTVIRGIPDLVLILLIFYGGQDLVNRIAQGVGYEQYIDINPFVAGVCTWGSSSEPTCRKPFAAPSWPFPRARAKPAGPMA